MVEVIFTVVTFWAFLIGLAIGMFIGYLIFAKQVVDKIKEWL